MNFRVMPWIVALPLWLAACGTGPLPVASQGGASTPALQPLDDCPSCGIVAPTLTFTDRFWMWSEPVQGGQQSGLERWTYGQTRQTSSGPEVFLLPAHTPVGAQVLSVGCLNEGSLEAQQVLPGPGESAFQSTPAVEPEILTTRMDADNLCNVNFGPGWRVATPRNMEGFWVAGQPPVVAEPTW
jgi:hypothetical protein